jgi:hypothetical protein
MAGEHLKAWGILVALTIFVVWVAVFVMVPKPSSFSHVSYDVVPWDQMGFPTVEIVARHGTFVAEYRGGEAILQSSRQTVEAIVTEASIYRQGQTATAMHSPSPTPTAPPYCGGDRLLEQRRRVYVCVGLHGGPAALPYMELAGRQEAKSPSETILLLLSPRMGTSLLPSPRFMKIKESSIIHIKEHMVPGDAPRLKSGATQYQVPAGLSVCVCVSIQ